MKLIIFTARDICVMVPVTQTQKVTSFIFVGSRLFENSRNAQPIQRNKQSKYTEEINLAISDKA